MVSIFNLIKFMVIFTLFLCCQIQATPINNDNTNDIKDIDLIEALDELFFNEQNRFIHQPNRRASLRYHPHVLYKKASLKPILGHNGRYVFTK